MKKVLFILLISCFSLTVISCSDDKEEYSATGTTDNTTTDNATTDTTAPVIAEVTAVTTPTNDTTPDYTFSSDEAGTITYGGSCSSSTTSAILYWFSVNWNFPCFELVLNDNPNRRIKCVRTERAIRLRRK